MREPITVPADFSENIQKTLEVIDILHKMSGHVSETHLEWLFTNVRNLESLTHATATFTNIADTFVEELQDKIAAKCDEIDDLNEIISDREDEIRTLSHELDEARAND